MAIFQKGVYYSGIKTFNTLPTEIEDISDNPKKFKIALNISCIHTSVYTLDEYFNPLNAELNPICHLLELLGAQHIFHVSGLRVNRQRVTDK